MFPQQSKWTEMKATIPYFLFCWKGAVIAEGKIHHLWYLAPYKSTSVEHLAPAEVLLLYFRQSCTQQARLTATVQGFKLDGLLITVA